MWHTQDWASQTSLREDGANTVLGGAFSDTKKEIFHLGSVNWW
jgi:hypothetical protein